MSGVITFKLIVEKDQKDTGDIRRVTLSQPAQYKNVLQAAKDLLGAEEVKFRYVDDDGDRIVVSSQYELDTAIGLSTSKNTIRLFVEVIKERSPEMKKVLKAKRAEKKLAEKPKAVEEKKPVEKPKVVEEKKPVEEPKVEEKKPAEIPVEEPKAEEKKPEEKPAAAAAAPQADANPFAELFRHFRDIPGVSCSQEGNNTGLVDIDFSKLFSAEGQNVWTRINEALAKALQAAEEQQKSQESAASSVKKPDTDAGVYSHVIHTMPASIVHYNVICDGCGKHDICGMRYKCAQCRDYDLCQDCIRRAGEIHDASHMFYPIAFPRCRPGRPFPCFMGRQQQPPFPNFRRHFCQPQPQPRPQPEPEPVKKPEPQPEPQPEPEKKPEPQPEPEKKPEPQPEPEKKVEPAPEEKPKDILLEPQYADLHLTPQEMESVHTLLEMGFENVELDVYFLRRNRGVIDDRVIEALAQQQ